jgi:FKBP-type peptidyl-prolyl cis-trans isomerase FkpA
MKPQYTLQKAAPITETLMRLVTRCLFLTAILTIGCSGSNTAAPSTSSGTFTQTDLVVGTGAEAVTGKVAVVTYSGWLYDTKKPDSKGTFFDGNSGFTFTLGAGTVIAGWDQGVVGMRVGGQRRLIIPPDLAYGSQGRSPIPPNATLVFDITLTGVQ